LTGRTLLYADDSTQKGRALAWLTKDDRKGANKNDDGNKTDGTATTTTISMDINDNVSLRQRYASGTFFTSPYYVSVENTWDTTLDECNPVPRSLPSSLA
jgi:hypothetical protein